MPKDAHEVLGVPRDAPWSKIERAYRRLAMKWHPDKNPQNPQAEERFKEIQWAYQKMKEERCAPTNFEPQTLPADYDHPFSNFFFAMRRYMAEKKENS